MLLLSGLLAPPFRGPVLIGAAATGLSAAMDSHAHLPSLPGSSAVHSALGAAMSGHVHSATNPQPTVILAWLLMLIAMMTPVIASPLSHVRTSSLRCRQGRSCAAFMSGYFGVWCLAGIPLLAAAFAIRSLTSSVSVALLTASAMALIWSGCPLQRAVLNRAHGLRRLNLFGLAAARDCIAFGAVAGGWCVASCWAWMLVPLLLPVGHVPAMLAVSAIVMSERLHGPGPPSWRVPVVLRPLSRATRIA